MQQMKKMKLNYANSGIKTLRISSALALLCGIVAALIFSSNWLEVLNRGGIAAETKIRVMTYNIGHYSDAGGQQNSPISVANFEAEKMKWRKLMYSIDADIIGLQEFSSVFCSGNGATSYDTIYKDLFKNKYEGVQRGYSCNAFFSNYDLLSIEIKEYECNKTAIITDGRPVKATDCYYLLAELAINGKNLTIIVTHQAFDLNNPQVELDQIDELITVLNTKERVIILGDFNVHAGVQGMDAFVDAGYTIANNGYIGNIATYPYPNVTKTLDNVVCSKNIKVKNVLADFVPINTNDHIPFVVDLVI